MAEAISTSKENNQKPNQLARQKLKVINLFGAPGMGKSSARSGIFWLMKSHHVSAEEVSEYAKYLVLSGRRWQLTEEQSYLFAKQHHKQLIIERSGYAYAVTDSPLELCSFYAPKGYYASFGGLVDEAAERFENINFFVSRELGGGEHFEEIGREHDRAQSLEVEQQMREFLARKGITYTELRVSNDLLVPWQVMDALGFKDLLRPDFSRIGA
jgi:hypothetical protein